MIALSKDLSYSAKEERISAVRAQKVGCPFTSFLLFCQRSLDKQIELKHICLLVGYRTLMCVPMEQKGARSCFRSSGQSVICRDPCLLYPINVYLVHYIQRINTYELLRVQYWICFRWWTFLSYCKGSLYYYKLRLFQLTQKSQI
jgi:hypothetical protein